MLGKKFMFVFRCYRSWKGIRSKIFRSLIGEMLHILGNKNSETNVRQTSNSVINVGTSGLNTCLKLASLSFYDFLQCKKTLDKLFSKEI